MSKELLMKMWTAKLNAKQREIETLRATQRFGSPSSPETIQKLLKVEAEVAQLLQDNEQMDLELKKKKLESTQDFAGFSQISSLSSYAPSVM